MKFITTDGSEATQLRPFYFVTVVWGARFRRYFLDFCLPSLLSANNLPALDKTRGSKFLICTTLEDWSAMKLTAIFGTLTGYVEPLFIEIPPAPPGVWGCEHMGIGHKKALDMAFRDKAYGVFLAPDCIISDGSIAALERHASTGKRIVLVSALRFGEEPLFANLVSLGIVGRGQHLSSSGEPLTVTGRQLVAAGIRSFHSETVRYGWESRCFSDHPEACWWPVPDEDGVVVHTTSWGPLLMDYATLERHDTWALEHWTLDGDYLYRNFGAALENAHVVTDSDEIMQVSWAPLADRALDLTPIPSRNGFFGELIKGTILRNHILNHGHDPLKCRLLFIPARWHSRPLSPAWTLTERKARWTLRFYLPELDREDNRSTTGGDFDAQQLSRFFWPWLRGLFLATIWFITFTFYVIGIVRRAIALPFREIVYRRQIAAVVKRALRGDVAAWRRILRRTGRYWRIITGVPVESE